MTDGEPSGYERVVVMDDEDFERLRDAEVKTCQYDHLPSVTLVDERWRQKWESPLAGDRPENQGTVLFLNDDDYRRIKYSVSGVHREGALLVHESKTHIALDDSVNHNDGVELET